MEVFWEPMCDGIPRTSPSSSRSSSGMPRHTLSPGKRRTTVKEATIAIATLDHHHQTVAAMHSPFNPNSSGSPSHHLVAAKTAKTHRGPTPVDSDEDQLPSPVSEDNNSSCDSGRDSALPGEPLSHSSSFDNTTGSLLCGGGGGRPSHLSLGSGGSSSSCSSSFESLPAKSPLSPFFYHQNSHPTGVGGIGNFFKLNFDDFSVQFWHFNRIKNLTLKFKFKI